MSRNVPRCPRTFDSLSAYVRHVERQLCCHLEPSVERMSRPQHQLQLLSVKQVASHLGVSAKTVRRMITRGDLPQHRVGRNVRVSQEDLRAYANSIRE